MNPAARYRLAGAVEIAANAAEHVSAGLQAVAEWLDPGDDEGATVVFTPDPAALTRYVDGDHVHLVPTADTREHDLSDDCPCHPRTTGFATTGKGDRWELTHNRLDQEEA